MFSDWVVLVVVPILSALLLLTFVVLLVFFIKRRKSQSNPGSSFPLQHIADDTLHNVTVEERLGGGNFGDVYRGTWQVTTVALKKLTDNSGSIDNEIKVLKGLNHANIVRYFGVHVSSANETFIVMEYMSLGSLNSFLQRKKGTGEVKPVHLIDM